MIGRPHIATGAAPALLAAAVRFGGGHHDLSALGPVVQAALAGRVGLVPTGEQATPVPLAVGPVEVVEPERPTGVGGVVIAAVYGVPLSGSLGERQLYDVALAGDGGWRTVAPHAVYHRRTYGPTSAWPTSPTPTSPGGSTRFRPTLYDLGRPEAAARMLQLERPLPGFIRYANYLHGIGALDVILATGDMYDYQFEYDDDGNGQGNALFLRDLILGPAPGPDFPDVEELRVPIFMVPGNHDYRKHPYHLYFDAARTPTSTALQLRAL